MTTDEKMAVHDWDLLFGNAADSSDIQISQAVPALEDDWTYALEILRQNQSDNAENLFDIARADLLPELKQWWRIAVYLLKTYVPLESLQRLEKEIDLLEFPYLGKQMKVKIQDEKNGRAREMRKEMEEQKRLEKILKEKEKAEKDAQRDLDNHLSSGQ